VETIRDRTIVAMEHYNRKYKVADSTTTVTHVHSSPKDRPI